MFNKKYRKSLIILPTVAIVGFILLLVYGLFIEQEFGMFIYFFESKKCAQATMGAPECARIGHAASTNLLYPTSLQGGLNYLLGSRLLDDSQLKEFSRNPSDWDCSRDGRTIESKRDEKVWSRTGEQIVFRCWPNK